MTIAFPIDIYTSCTRLHISHNRRLTYLTVCIDVQKKVVQLLITRLVWHLWSPKLLVSIPDVSKFQIDEHFTNPEVKISKYCSPNHQPQIHNKVYCSSPNFKIQFPTFLHPPFKTKSNLIQLYQWFKNMISLCSNKVWNILVP